MKFNNLVLTGWFVFVIIAILFVSQKAHATPEKEHYEYCTKLGQTAALIIRAREEGTPAKDLYDAFPNELDSLVRIIYNRPDLTVEMYPSAVVSTCMKYFWGSV